MTVSAFYLFWEFIFSLWKGKGNLFDDSIPKWGSHWSYVCAWMYVYEMMRGCVCAHESVEGVALAPLVLSVKLPWRAFLFSDAPLRRQTQFLHLIFISLLTTEFAVCVNKKRKDRMCHKYFTRSNFHLQVKELSFLPPCWEHLFALLFCLTGLPLIRTKRHEEAPWRLSVGMTSLQNIFTLWATPEELRDMH